MTPMIIVKHTGGGGIHLFEIILKEIDE